MSAADDLASHGPARLMAPPGLAGSTSVFFDEDGVRWFNETFDAIAAQAIAEAAPSARPAPHDANGSPA